ncbi:MAG: hypothetical protein R2856_12155 [Caldilineaceae bacterium]
MAASNDAVLIQSGYDQGEGLALLNLADGTTLAAAQDPGWIDDLVLGPGNTWFVAVSEDGSTIRHLGSDLVEIAAPTASPARNSSTTPSVRNCLSPAIATSASPTSLNTGSGRWIRPISPCRSSIAGTTGPCRAASPSPVTGLPASTPTTKTTVSTSSTPTRWQSTTPPCWVCA